MSEYYKKTWENNVSKQLEKQRKMILDFQSRYQGALERIEQLTMDVSRLKVQNDKYREALEVVANGEAHPLRYYQLRDLAREALKGE